MDFFEQSNAHLSSLNENEKKIFEYITREIHSVQDMQIRVLAEQCYVSTTTIIRFSKKLGFAGYRQMQDAIKYSCHQVDQTDLPNVLWKKDYSEEYIKNMIESIRVISLDKIKAFRNCLENEHAVIYCYGKGMDKEIAHYAYHMLSAMGYRGVFLEEDYEISSALKNLKDNDMLFLFSLSGKDTECIQIVEQAHLRCKPVVATITQSANNPLQAVSDIDFYVFTDQVTYRSTDLTARVSMIAIIELLVFNLMSSGK